VKIFVKIIIILLFLLLSKETHSACTVETTGISYGTYDVFSTTSTNSTGTITVTCDESPPPSVTLSIGPSPNSGGFNPRKLRHESQSDLLNYNLFTDASMTVIWGDGTQGTSTLKQNVTKGKPWIATVYGRIPAGQDISAGQYSETVSVTITW
jgi:spore coat protein U-like protein